MEIIWVEGNGPGFELAREVRRRVFVEEQGFSEIGEFDQTDRVSTHIIGVRNHQPVCTARMYEELPGIKHIGRVAVLDSLRGTGLGKQMMELLAERAREQGGQEILLSAQADKTIFYERVGYRATGNTSLDEGVPHVEMRLVLA